MDTHNPFTAHELVSETLTDSLGSWLCQRRYKDTGNFDSTFWVRITAAEGLLTVTGDIDPVTFAHGPRDPKATVMWIGGHGELDSYIMEKATIGMGGRHHVTMYSAASANKEIEQVLGDPEVDLSATEREALEEIGENLHDYHRIHGVHALADKIYDELGHDTAQCFGGFGEEPAPHVRLALRAINRLVELLGRK